MNNTRDHQELVDKLQLAFGSRPDVRIWIRVVGFDRERNIKYGITGEPDLEGIVSPLGRMLCIEVKTGKGVLSKEQKLRRAMLLKFGAIYIEARLGADRDFDKAVKNALAEFEKLKLAF